MVLVSLGDSLFWSATSPAMLDFSILVHLDWMLTNYNERTLCRTRHIGFCQLWPNIVPSITTFQFAWSKKITQSLWNSKAIETFISLKCNLFFVRPWLASLWHQKARWESSTHRNQTVQHLLVLRKMEQEILEKLVMLELLVGIFLDICWIIIRCMQHDKIHSRHLQKWIIFRILPSNWSWSSSIKVIALVQWQQLGEWKSLLHWLHIKCNHWDR